MMELSMNINLAYSNYLIEFSHYLCLEQNKMVISIQYHSYQMLHYPQNRKFIPVLLSPSFFSSTRSITIDVLCASHDNTLSPSQSLLILVEEYLEHSLH